MLTTSRHIIVIKKLNNIMINCLQNPRATVLHDKWHFDSSQDWKTLALDFEGFNTDDIADGTLRTFSFHISATQYLEEEFPRFKDILDLELTTKPAMVNNLGQIVMDSEEKVVKKKNNCAAKRKKWLAKLCISVGSFSSLCSEFSLLLSPCFLPAPVPALMPALVPALVPTPVPAPVPAPFFCPRSSVVLSSDHLPALATISRCRIPTFMLPLSVFDSPLPLRPLFLRTFKQFLLDEPRPRVSISFTKPFHLFPAFGALNPNNNNRLYNPTNKNKCKQGFDTAFINFRLLANNHN